MSERFERLRGIHVTDPVLILGLEGWFDSGYGAAGAVAGLLAAVDTEPVIRFDADTYIDHRARRPVVRIVDGRLDELTWPNIHLRHGTDSVGKDILVLAGPEPDMRWHDFAADVVTLAKDLGVRTTVAIGAYPNATPHTRPIRVIAAGTDDVLVRRVGFVPGTIDVPAGMQSVLELALADAGIPSVGLWAQVPHYLSGTPFPPASAAILDTLADVADLELDLDELHATAVVARQRVDSLIQANDEHRQLVAALEEQYDAAREVDTSPLSPANLPSADELAAELERFLRGEQG